MKKITVLGSGAFGTALALAAARVGTQTCLWGRRGEILNEIRKGVHPRLGTLTLPATLHLEDDIDRACAGSSGVVLAIPVQHMRTFLATHHNSLHRCHAPFLLVSKGFEVKTGNLISEILTDSFPHKRFAVLGGPHLAKEIAYFLPTCGVFASEDKETASGFASCFQNSSFATEVTDSPSELQIWGALKNIYAVLAGIVRAQAWGENAFSLFFAKAIRECRDCAIFLQFSCDQKGLFSNQSFSSTSFSRSSFFSAYALPDFLATVGGIASRNVQAGMRIAQSCFERKSDTSENQGALAEGLSALSGLHVRLKKRQYQPSLASQPSEDLWVDTFFSKWPFLDITHNFLQKRTENNVGKLQSRLKMLILNAV